MNHHDNQNRDHDLRERIVNRIRSNDQAHRQAIPKEELDKLKTAARRLDQILQSAENADQQALRGAAGRLDQLLADIRTGKDVSQSLKRRQAGRKP